MAKTYEQRLNEIAEEMARFDYEEQFQNSKVFTWDKCTHSIKQERIANKISAAAIALKHMAEMYYIGFTDGIRQESNIDSLGLIQPQKP